VIVYNSPQGTEAWLSERRGVITGSRFKDCRDRLKNGDLSSKARLYAMDVARERIGGQAQQVYVTAAMRFGTEQEPKAREHYELTCGELVDGAGFICTDDRKFGCSVDGLVGADGLIEIKTMVSSDTLFKAVVDGDISEYVDQVNGAMWLLGRRWCDLILWAPDLPEGGQMTVHRIVRDDDEVNRLEADLLTFERIVSQYEAKLAERIRSNPLAMAA